MKGGFYMTLTQQRFYVSEDINDILDLVVKENPDLPNRSAALRFLIFERYKDYEQSKTRISKMSKELSMAVEILCSMSDSVHSKIVARESTVAYTQSKELVEKRIKTNASQRKFG